MGIAVIEDDVKRALRSRCVQAIDRAAYQLIDPPGEFTPSPHIGIRGFVRGDLHAQTTTGMNLLYFLFPDSERTVPGWLQNYARAVMDMEVVEIHVVVPIKTNMMTQSCKSLGIGMLEIDDDNTFRLVVAPSVDQIAKAQDQFLESIRDLRTKLRIKIEMDKAVITNDVVVTRNLVASMDLNSQNEFLGFAIPQVEEITKWGDELSAAIDRAQEATDTGAIRGLTRAIASGVPKDA